MRYDEDQTRLIIARLVAPLLWLFWLFLLWRFHRLLREARMTEENATAAKAKAAAAEAASAATGRIGMGEYVMINGRRGKITSDDGTSNSYKVTYDNGEWQLVVWARQGLLFLVYFAMDCVMLFLPYWDHWTARFVFAALVIAVLGGFWRLQARRQPYAMRQQHWLETFLYAVDILVIILAAYVYSPVQDSGTVQDRSMRLVFEQGLGALLGASVLVAVLVAGFNMECERQLFRNWVPPFLPYIDAPIEAALRDGAVRLIDCAWLLDSDRSDKNLPRVTKVVARLASNEPTSVLIRRLAKRCGTSSICITVETASAASPVRLRWRWWWTP
ncbi:hypothetical protein Ctob_008939, partial [Chrysochromulina tobinii]